MAKEKGGEKEGTVVLGMRISRTGALIIAVILLVITIALIYLGLMMMVSRQPYTPPGVGVGGIQTPTPVANWTGSAYTESQLISEYGVDSIPQLIVNCNYRRVGTFASKEQSFEVSPGTERQDLINGICRSTGKQNFCALQAQTIAVGVMSRMSKPACAGEDGKVKIYAFHSPSCSRSADQRAILESLAVEFQYDLEVIYICTPADDNDRALCAQAVASGEYAE